MHTKYDNHEIIKSRVGESMHPKMDGIRQSHTLSYALRIVTFPSLLLKRVINQKTEANLSLLLQWKNLIAFTLLSVCRQKFVLLVFKILLS